MLPGVRRSKSQIIGFPSAMPTTPHLSAHLEKLADGARDYVDAASSANTRRGCVANFSTSQSSALSRRISSGDYLELFLDRWCRIERETALALSHHVNHLDAGQGVGCRAE